MSDTQKEIASKQFRLNSFRKELRFLERQFKNYSPQDFAALRTLIANKRSEVLQLTLEMKQLQSELEVPVSSV